MAGISLLLVGIPFGLVFQDLFSLLQRCGLYYWIWIKVMPQLGGYEIVEEIDELADGARNTRLVRRYKHTADNEHEPLLSR